MQLATVLGRTSRLARGEPKPPKRRDDFVDRSPRPLGCGASRSLPLASLACGPRRLALAAHEVRPERELRSVLIVGAAAQPNSGHRGRPVTRHRLYVIEFEQPARRAAAAGFANERAPPAVALPDGASDMGRNVTGRRARLPAASRASRSRELAPLELLDQCIERAVQHQREFASGQLMGHQVLCVLELVACRAPN
jgi:hypothetical protein